MGSSANRAPSPSGQPAGGTIDHLDETYDLYYPIGQYATVSDVLGITRNGATLEDTMQDPKKGHEPDDASPAPQPAKGGFGQFAEVYRARWAANHPNMRPRDYGDTDNAKAVTPLPAAPAEPAVPAASKPPTRIGTRLFRPED
jgi:hypothetical protein